MAPYISDDQILSAALDLMAEKGYAGATTLQIAAAAEVSEVTLFRRYGSKKNLLLAAVKHEAEKFNAGEIGYTGDVEADLLTVVSFYQSLVNTRGQFIAMLLSEVPRQPELREVVQVPLAIIGRITELIRNYQQEGVLEVEPVESAFAALVGPLFLDAVFNFVQPESSFSLFNSQEHVRRFIKGRVPE